MNRVSPYLHEDNFILKIDFLFISNLNFLQSYGCEFKLIICTHVEKIQTGSLTWEKIKVKDLSTEKETQGRMREIKSSRFFWCKIVDYSLLNIEMTLNKNAIEIDWNTATFWFLLYSF